MESVRHQGLEAFVHYLGPRKLEHIVEAIQECDIGIIPNQRNIFTELNTPTRIFEYFDESSLIFFELGNAEDLARKMEYVYRSPEEILEITRRAQTVQRAHTWREEKRILTGLVAELLHGNGVQRS
jgi:hypothetical protein